MSQPPDRRQDRPGREERQTDDHDQQQHRRGQEECESGQFVRMKQAAGMLVHAGDELKYEQLGCGEQAVQRREERDQHAGEPSGR